MNIDLEAHLFLVSGSLLLPSDREVLQTAQAAVEAAIDDDKWIAKTTFPIPPRPLRGSGNEYIYLRTPPQISQYTKPTTSLNWDHPIQKEELFDLETLEEFESTDFTFLRSLNVGMSNRNALKPEQVTQNIRMENLLPLPHYHPSSECPRKADLPSIPQHPVFAYLHASAPLTLQSSWTRTVWIIPVGGSLSVADPRLTLASIVKGPPLVKTSAGICWTEESIRAFWDFLIMTRSRGLFGSLGLSFECMKNKNKVSSKHARCIKVYHDATFAMHLRTVFDRFKFADCTAAPLVDTGINRSEPPNPPPVTKRRILKHARLLLVDHFGQGLLIS